MSGRVAIEDAADGLGLQEPLAAEGFRLEVSRANGADRRAATRRPESRTPVRP